jgi:acetyltransferase-like isoleucine patch superfamily enzyme
MNFKSVGENVKIFDRAKIVFPENIEIGNNVIIDDFVLIIAKKKIKIGSNVHIGAFASIVGNEEVIMEDFSGISQGVKIFTSTEDFRGSYLSNPTVPSEFKNVYSAPVIIKKFGLVGANTVILPGSIIEEGTSIGANSLVYKTTEPYSFYAGSPVKKIGEKNKDQMLLLEKKYKESING